MTNTLKIKNALTANIETEAAIAIEKQTIGIDEYNLKQLDNKKYANDIDKQLGISNRNTMALKILSFYSIKRKLPFTPTILETKIVQDFLRRARGDMEINAALKKIYTSAGDIMPTGFSTEDQTNSFFAVVNEIMAYTYKTRHLETFTQAFPKLVNNFNNWEKNLPSAKESRISLQEYSSVHAVSRIKSVLKNLEQNGFLAGAQDLVMLSNQSNKSFEMLSKMEKSFQIPITTKPGRIVLSNAKKVSCILGECMSFFEKMVAKFINKHLHASKVYTRTQGEFQSHIFNMGPDNNQFEMRDYLYSDIYRIDIGALIPSEQRSNLNKVFGAKWEHVISNMYANIERQIHDSTQEKFRSLSAGSKWEQYKSGLASLFFGLGHKKFQANDFDKIHDQVFSQFYQTGKHHMLCSEFVAHTTIAALVELNRKLETIMIARDPNFRGPVIKIPFGKHEDLRRMYPDRLLKVLRDHHCLIKESPTPIIKGFFKKNRVEKTGNKLDH